MAKKIFGMLRFIFHFASSKNRYVLDNIVKKLSPSETCPREKKFVLMVGFAKSGKSAYIRDRRKLRNYFCISSARIHRIIDCSFEFLRDDKTVTGFAYWERQFLTWIIRERLLKIALDGDYNVVNDSANLTLAGRSKLLKLAKKYGYSTRIIHICCSEKLLIRRLKSADDLAEKNGKPGVWLDLYEVQKKIMQEPSTDEADCILHYRIV